MSFRELLSALYPEGIPHSLVITGPVGDAWVSAWCPSIDAAVQVSEERGEGALYFGLALMDELEARKESAAEGSMILTSRGKAKHARALGGLWAEVDYQGPGHKGKGLPPDIAAAQGLLADLKLQPSAVVASGGGLHAYWLLHEVWELDSDEERSKAHATVSRLQAALRAEARAKGWNAGVDPIADLARVLRVPGSWNRKVKDRPVEVEILSIDPGLRYDPLDFEAFPEVKVRRYPKAGTKAKAQEEPPPARYGDVIGGCAWMAHCVSEDGAKTLSEPAWYAMASVLGRCQLGDVDGAALFHEASRPYPKYRPQEAEAKLARALERGPVLCGRVEESLGGEDFCQGCAHRGQIKSPILLGRGPKRAPTVAAGPARDLGQRLKVVKEAPCSESANATRFVREAKGGWIFCKSIGAWFGWDGTCFRKDTTDASLDDCRRLVPAAIYRDAAEAADGTKDGQDVSEALSKWARTSQSHAKLTNTLNLAKADPRIRVSPEDLDADPMLLNLPNGTADLKACKFYPRDEDDRSRVTKVTQAAYDESARCPRWEQFLGEVFIDKAGQPDPELIAYVQRAVGYSLTGEISEHALFLLHGRGSNGKTVFLETLSHVLGDYAQHIDFVALLAEPGGRQKRGPNEDVARLRGSRFVVASEADSGARFSESTVKRLTGGDAISAEFKYGHQFTFKPSHKLWLAVNDKPQVRDQSHGFWRRIKLLPLRAKFLPPERAEAGAKVMDKKLPEALRMEASGILMWALEGLEEWIEKGLGTCQAVSQETDSYRMEEDPLADFLGAKCELEADALAPCGELYASYAKYCEDAGEKPFSPNAFGRLVSKVEGVSRPVSKRMDSGKIQKVRKGIRLSLTLEGSEARF